MTGDAGEELEFEGERFQLREGVVYVEVDVG